MSESAHILIVDDDPRVRDMVSRYLTQEGFRVSAAETGEAMRACMTDSDVELVLLDLVLPDADGLNLVRELREQHDVPVIMLSGRGDMVDRVVGLEMGADDYIAKPFHLREVLARIKSVLRRSRPHALAPGAEEPAAAPAGDDIAFDGWHLNLARRELTAPDGAVAELTTGEFELLSAFARNPNRVLNRDQLMDLTKSRDWSPYDRSIDTQVGRLRKKVERDPSHPELIKTVRGVGYVFTPKN